MDDQIEDPKRELFILWTHQTQKDSSYYLFV